MSLETEWRKLCIPAGRAVPAETSFGRARQCRTKATGRHPKGRGWTLRVLTVERTAAGERVVAVLDRLARREVDNPDLAAALVATLNGASAVLAVTARDGTHVERVGSALGGPAR